MIFKDVPYGETVFLDANTLLFHFTTEARYGAACTDFLERIERNEVTALTSTHVLSEVAHRMMTIEVSLRFGRPFAGIVRWMEQHPAEVQQLTRFRQALQEVSLYHVRVVTIAPDLLDAAATVSQQSGLLHNDSLIVAIMQANGLTNLASADADFDRVPGIKRYAPV
jgi:predicted nucleic acid-binding protein